MKTLLTVTLVSICAVGLYSKEITGALGLAGDAQSARPITLDDLVHATSKHDDKHHAMTAEELIEMAKKDPNAYQKFLQSHEEPEDRNEVDKLMNWFAHGKYE